MNNTSLELVEKLIHEKKYDTIQEFVSIAHMGKKPLCFREYTGTEVRGFEEDGNINLLIPEACTAIQESALAKAITSGSIFDDAEDASRGSVYIRLTIVPSRAFAKTNPTDLPKCLGTFTKACVGQMDSDGRIPCTQAAIDNGANFERDVLTSGEDHKDLRDIVCHHLSIPEDKPDLPGFLGKSIFDLKKGMSQIKDFKAEDTLDDDDYEEIDPTAEAEDDVHDIEETETAAKLSNDIDKSFDGENEETLPDADDDDAKEAAKKDENEIKKPTSSDDDSDEGDDDDDDDDDTDDDDDDDDDVDDFEECGDTPFEEGFISRRPKKLKPLPARDIVSYITVEMNAIRDSNDQAMLAGYTCSKLELCDFYINCIDTQDDRYVVPHDRAYLVRFQSDLNRLLTQILAIKPVNKADRVWKVNVTYPEGWRG